MKDPAMLKPFQHAGPTIALFAVFCAAYALSLYVPPGPVTFALALPAWVVMWLTAVVRLNDIPCDHVSLRWQLRRGGLAFSAAGLMAVVFQVRELAPNPPTWGELMLYWGIALTWLTTPGLPPWLYYVTGIKPPCGEGP